VRGRRPLAATLGLRFKPSDVPVGVGCGLASQFLLVPLLYLPLRAVNSHIYRDLGKPAESLTRRAHGRSTPWNQDTVNLEVILEELE